MLCRKICLPIVGVSIHETKWFSQSHPKANQSLPTVGIDTLRIRVFAKPLCIWFESNNLVGI